MFQGVMRHSHIVEFLVSCASVLFLVGIFRTASKPQSLEIKIPSILYAMSYFWGRVRDWWKFFVLKYTRRTGIN